MKNAGLAENVRQMLYDTGVLNNRERSEFFSRYALTPISADGSARRFFRVERSGESLCVGVAPQDTSTQNMAEAHSVMAIGRHLLSKNIPIPEILGSDELTGVILFEDCGDLRLHDVLRQENTEVSVDHSSMLEIYRRLVAILARMQVRGAESFNRQWCYDTPEYDTSVMVGRESHYFLNEFWHNLLQGEPCPGIEEEFADIAIQAGTGLNGFFLHRDFQSRNVMLINSQLKIIDFQGGRLGPPAYDLASLLIDPYSEMPEEMQFELMSAYLSELRSFFGYDEKVFLRQYAYLALQRNLQILGAFSFLSQKRGKPFFKEYIQPALGNLCRLLEEKELRPYSQLRGIVHKAQDLFQSL